MPFPFPVTVRIPVQWGDMDALGHVNNTVYLRWFETARIACFARTGVPADAPGALGPILATTTCDFLQPVVFPATVEVGARVARVGNTSMALEYGVRRVDDDVLVARGSDVVVLVDYTTGEKVSVPEPIRRAIAAL